MKSFRTHMLSFKSQVEIRISIEYDRTTHVRYLARNFKLPFTSLAESDVRESRPAYIRLVRRLSYENS